MRAPSLSIPALTGRSADWQTGGAWLALMGLVAIDAAVLGAALPGALRDPQQRSFFAPASIVVVTLIGLLGSFFADRTGIPPALDSRVTQARRWIVPALTGLGIGVVLVGYDLVTHFARANAEHFGLSSQYTGVVAMSLSFFAAAAIAVGLIDLLPVPGLTYLVSNVIMRGRAQATTYWMVAAVVSLLEPVSQDAWAFQAGQWTFGPVFAIQYLANLLELLFFRRVGLLGAITFRLGVYVIWHVVYPH